MPGSSLPFEAKRDGALDSSANMPWLSVAPHWFARVCVHASILQSTYDTCTLQLNVTAETSFDHSVCKPPDQQRKFDIHSHARPSEGFQICSL